MSRRAEKGRRSRAPLPAGFGAVWSCVAVDLVGFGIVLPILPLYARRFGASPTTIGMLVASFSLAQLVFAPALGRLSDRIGRKPVLVLSLAGTAVASLVTGLAGTLWLLFAARVFDGASGASVSVAQATVIDLAAPEERSRLLGLLGAAFGLGFVAGPVLGGLAALVDPKLPFFVAALIAGANAVVANRRLPETNPREGAVMAGAVPAGDPTAGDPTAGDPTAGPDPTAGAVTAGDPTAGPDPTAGAVTAGDPTAGPDPTAGAVTAGDPTAGPGPSLRLYALVAFVALAAFSAFEATFALFGQRRLGFGEASTAGVFAGVGLLIVVVQVRLVRPMVGRVGDRGALRCGLLVNAAGLLALAGVESRVSLVPALILLTAGQGLVSPTLSALVGGRAAAGRRGGALGVQQAAGGLGRVAGPVAGGALFQHVGTAAPYLGGAALMVAAALLVTQA